MPSGCVFLHLLQFIQGPFHLSCDLLCDRLIKWIVHPKIQIHYLPYVALQTMTGINSRTFETGSLSQWIKLMMMIHDGDLWTKSNG